MLKKKMRTYTYISEGKLDRILYDVILKILLLMETLKVRFFF